jgi:putative ABC transport system substrate-binding protein
MRRREFIILLGSGATAAWPLAARAQQQAMPVIGFLRNTLQEDSAYLVGAIRQGLKETGYVEGQNVAIEFRWANNRSDRLPTLAADLVRRQCAVIIAGGNAPTLAARAATATIPIIFATGEDPVDLGFVSKLSRPGGNVTGVTFYGGALVAKQLELLREIAPKAAVVGMLVNSSSPGAELQVAKAQAAGHALGQTIHVLNAREERDIDAAFASFAQQHVDALIFGGDALFTGQRDRLVGLVARLKVPAVFNLKEFVAAGGLMSYGASTTDAYRQVGIYAGRILKGEKPADLPVMLPSKFELAVNLNTAKTLGLEVPWFLQQRADEVIE